MERKSNREKTIPIQPKKYITSYCKADKELLPTDGPFSYKGLTRWATYPDGSCLVHAILNAFWKPYRKGRLNDKVLDRLDYVKKLRHKLAEMLEEPIDKNDPTGPTNYDILSNGSLRELAQSIPDCSLERMKKVLDSTSFLGYVYLEYFSDRFDIDIYIIDLEKMDVYTTGRSDDEIYYKSRDSIVIGYVNEHFETLSVKTSPSNYETFFSTDSPFIRAIWKRRRELVP
jgi:hypothetical protein